MTDTRKHFEDWYAIHIFKGSDNYDWNFETWQACQQLNDKRIADLLAVIVKKDEALNSIMEYDGTPNETDEDVIQMMTNYEKAIQLTTKALAITPESVELVEVGKVQEVGGSLFASQHSPNNGVKVGDKLYTINQKG